MGVDHTAFVAFGVPVMGDNLSDALEEHAGILAVRNLAYATYGNCYSRGGW